MLEETNITELTDIRSLGMVLSNIRIPLKDGHSVGLILGIYACTIPADSIITISEEHVGYDWFLPAKAAELLQVKYPREFCELVAKL